MIAKVIIDIHHTSVDKPFDYKVPVGLSAFVQTGQRVKVLFNGKKRIGIIIGLKKTTRQKKVQSMVSLIDVSPFLTQDTLDLATYLSKKYARPLYTYLELFIPRLERVKKDVILKCEYHSERYADILKNPSKPILYDSKLVSEGLKKHDLVLEETKFFPKIKSQSMIQLIDAIPVKGKKQKAIIEILKEKGPISLKYLKDAYDVSSATVKSLIQKAVIQQIDTPKYLDTTSFKEVVPSNDQYTPVLSHLKTDKLLVVKPKNSHEALDLLIQVANSKDLTQKIIILYPETLMAELNYATLQTSIKGLSLYHSKMSETALYEASLRFNEFGVLMGTKMALFHHLNEVDMIIVMEAHDAGYQSLQPPVIDGMDVVEHLIENKRVKTLVVTHTPPFAMVQHILNDAFDLIDFTRRKKSFRRLDLKSVKVSQSGRSISSELIDLIKASLNHNHHVLLFQNFKGTHQSLVCPLCNKAPLCDTCHNPLTYDKGGFRCHPCDTCFKAPLICPECHVEYQLVYAGLDRIQKELDELFTNTKVVLVDGDHAKPTELIKQFNEDASIFVSTQVMSRGILIPRLGLKVLMDFDRLVSLKTYDARFNVCALTRGLIDLAGGDTLVQTAHPDHPLLDHIEDSARFYDQSLRELKKLDLPPFTQMAQVLFEDASPSRRDHLSQNMVTYLKKALRDHVTIIGPSFKINQVIITLKSKELHHYYATLSALSKAFKEETTVEIRHFHYVV